MKLDHTCSSSDTPRMISDSVPVTYLPPWVTDVPKDALKGFPHTKRVGNYLLGKTLGEGSFAKVKEGFHTLTGEKVAIKVIDKKKAKEDAYVRKNLRREGKLLQMVRHKNVVRLYEIMETENSYYLVTELCQGGDLMDHICSKKKLEERETKKYIRQIISAVDYLHKAGILHRDLKVENLLLDSNRDIKIIDFGLSNSVRVQQTREGGSQIQEYCVTQCGSPAYAAPELLGNNKYGPKVDIWSIGVNMYAMLTGNLPFTVEPFNIKALHNKMLKGEHNPIPEHLTRNCRDLLKRFLTPAVNERISLQEAMEHPWVTDGRNRPLTPAPFPNKLSSDSLNHTIIKHMAHNMDFRMGEVIRLVSNNVPNSSTATYNLLLKRLETYSSKQSESNVVKPLSDTTNQNTNNSRQTNNKQSPAGSKVPDYHASPATPAKSNPKTLQSVMKTPFQVKANTNSHVPSTYTTKENKPERNSTSIPTSPKKDPPAVRKDLRPAIIKEHSTPSKRFNGSAMGDGSIGDMEEVKEVEPEKEVEEEEEEEEGEAAEAEEVKVITLPRSHQQNGMPRTDAFTSVKSPPAQDIHTTTRTEPLFRCTGPPGVQRKPHGAATPSTLPDLPAIVSRQNTEDKIVTNHHSTFTTNRPKTFSTPPTHHNVPTNHRSGGAVDDESSESTTSSSHGQHSTCSNPGSGQSSTKPFQSQVAADKGCISDPSTRQERKSAFTRPPAPSKKVVIDVGNYDKYSRDKNGNVIVSNLNNGTDATGKSFPSSSQGMEHSKLITHTRRLVNLVYPSYGSAASKTAAASARRHTGVGGARTARLPDTNNKVQMLMREKTTIGTSRLTGIGRTSLDHAFTTTKLQQRGGHAHGLGCDGEEEEEDKMMELRLGTGPPTHRDTTVDTNKVGRLPLLSPSSPRKPQQFL